VEDSVDFVNMLIYFKVYLLNFDSASDLIRSFWGRSLLKELLDFSINYEAQNNYFILGRVMPNQFLHDFSQLFFEGGCLKNKKYV